MTNTNALARRLALAFLPLTTIAIACDGEEAPDGAASTAGDDAGQATTQAMADDGSGDGVEDGAEDEPADGDDDAADDGAGTDEGAGSSGGSEGDDGVAADCTDQMILDLGLVEGVVSEGVVTNTADGGGFLSSVDATAGGIANAADNPWMYLRFAEDGLERVALDDLEALASTEWDIAAKRFGIRLNSGVSGPSTVRAALADGEDYDALTELPQTAALLEEAFYDAQCFLIDDGTGQGAPNYLMTPWWFYPGCVGTTGTPFVIELADGRRLKFVIDAYYESGQQTCNSEGAMGMGSANYTWRWAMLAR